MLSTAALVAERGRAVWLSPDGELEQLEPDQALNRVRTQPVLVCHAPATFRRLGSEPVPALDVLELFAFVRPARFCLPTVRGLAAVLDLTTPASAESAAQVLVLASKRLLAELIPDRSSVAIARAASAGGWAWGPILLDALDEDAPPPGPASPVGLNVWRDLPEWDDTAPRPQPGNQPVEPAESRWRLAALLGAGAEDRPQQADYASAVTSAFQPREQVGEPHVVLAEAGTGTGKTLGYVAPASLWAERNGGVVWLSTYTRNLQRQLVQELARLYPDPDVRADKAVTRKGRENYLCLLNLEEAVGRIGTMRRREVVALSLLLRWAMATEDGDLGGDFPAWLVDLVGGSQTLGLSDRRGECIYSACQHYGRCFVERSVRRAQQADLVIANHALVMIQAALGAGDDPTLPLRYVFDEGHHLFDAADNAFAGHLTGRETAELRRWVIGGEGSARRRGRGLGDRIGDLFGDDQEALEVFQGLLGAVRALPGPGWPGRISDGRPSGAAELFLEQVRAQVYARAPDPRSPHGLETEPHPLQDDVHTAAAELAGAFGRIATAMADLQRRLRQKLDDEAEELDTGIRNRIEAACRGLDRRGRTQAAGWRQMLTDLDAATPAAFADWFGVERIDGRDVDVGMYRHWVDPMQPFAEVIAPHAHGLVITSATLTDRSGDAEADWQAAEHRTGAGHLPAPGLRVQVPSPFDYSAQTRVFIVNDVRKDDFDQVAAAYRELFLAAGGGALGLFTAVARLKAVHERLQAPVAAAGLPLYAQHIDRMNVATLIDIFRAEAESCLLGTDAVRDGIDVPGESLRLIVFDRVPWPRPSILHKARRAAFGQGRYVDSLTRYRLAQAYGRLIRRDRDRGVFVLLDPMMPTRLCGAFPEDVSVARVGLAEALSEVRGFLAQGT